MIKISIETDGKDLLDSIDEDKPTLNECALIVYRLEEMKKYLLSKEFANKFKVTTGDHLGDDDDNR